MDPADPAAIVVPAQPEMDSASHQMEADVPREVTIAIRETDADLSGTLVEIQESVIQTNGSAGTR